MHPTCLDSFLSCSLILLKIFISLFLLWQHWWSVSPGRVRMDLGQDFKAGFPRLIVTDAVKHLGVISDSVPIYMIIFKLICKAKGCIFFLLVINLIIHFITYSFMLSSVIYKVICLFLFHWIHYLPIFDSSICMIKNVVE